MTLQERDFAVVWHPFTPQKDRKAPIPIVKGEKTLLFDEQGKAYIDAISSWWVTLHGHANAYIAEKIYKQALTLEQVIFAGFTHEPAVSLAERLLPILPNKFEKIFYSDNGSTATEVALKMALQYWWNLDKQNKRTKIVAFKDAYHGDTFGAMSVSDRSVFTLAFHDKLFEIIVIDTPTSENIQQLKKNIQKQADEIAAFIYEPLVQGAGGMKIYDALLMDELLTTIKQNNIICIADEVMTGFGRTGQLFASNYLQNKPDIICLSKGLTGGTMALGVTACTAEIYNAFVNDDKLKTFFHGHSFTANPLACTAALASLDLLLQTPTLTAIENIAQANKNFAAKFLLNNTSLDNNIKNVRCLGTILAFEVVVGKDEYLNKIASVITEKALEKGVYIRPLGNTVYIMPPYCITDVELQKVYSFLEELIQNI